MSERYADAPERAIPVIEVPADEGFATLDLADGQKSPALNTIAVLSLPCPGQRIRGGVGGQAMTPCSFCGEVMASTAGPHSRDGRMAKPVVIDWLGEGDLIGWRPFLLALAAAPEPTSITAGEPQGGDVNVVTPNRDEENE